MSDTALGAAAVEHAPPPPQAKWTGLRIAGYLLVSFWSLAGLGLIWFLVDSYSPVFVVRYGPKFISGFIVTIELVLVSIILGALISLPIAFGRMSRNRIIGAFAYAYVYFFRGTPLIAQTFLVYYGAGSFREFFEDINLWWFFRDAWYCAIFTFSLNTAAYQAEILRGAIENVPRGQIEAGQSLGLPRWVIFIRVVLPQAFIVALRPYGNEIILMIKGSAIASVITVYDLMGETKRAFSRSYDFQTYLWAAIMYLVIVETLRRFWDKLDARLTRHLERAG
ncbi:ABC transporter permease [Breoghania sp. L-A4]|uniref:ABC transporter permease n=1 Tax=Breoghania sp. L-A4 TaxID=2304600 RepID=UPI000E36047B|nr:ABC transporter permease [Breoghania sp. L-A4]AXS40117.1 ABC transporter permease subunit [Breoghania sp. L-A4]